MHRDTFKCAFKCSEITVNGKSNAVFKDPATDPGKASKKGRLTVQKVQDTNISPNELYKSSKDAGTPGGRGIYHKAGDYVTVADGRGDKKLDLLVEVFCDGELKKDWTLDEIRKRADVADGPFQACKIK